MDDRKQEIPSLDLLRMELAREESRYEFWKTLRHIAGILAVAAAITALMVTRLFMLLQVNGMSMAPTLREGEIVILHQTKKIEKGDMLGFYYGGKVLLKRALGSAGDYIDMDQEGNVYVNGEMLEETYLEKKGLGKCQLDFPYQVPEGMLFVLGDNREVSLDSRIRAVGCVESSQIVGRVVCRVWPLARMEMMR